MKYKDFYLHLLTENEDYRMDHKAPDPDSGAPLCDVTLNGIYPTDIYEYNGNRMYGDMDNPESWAIVSASRNRPKRSIKIYRAIPDFNFSINKRLDRLYSFKGYLEHRHFRPDWDLFTEFEKKIPHLEFKDLHPKMQTSVDDEIAELEKQKTKPIKINKGDWVTISKRYAIEHGKTNLDKYKILSKTVRANQIYTDGNIHEWGYYP